MSVIVYPATPPNNISFVFHSIKKGRSIFPK